MLVLIDENLADEDIQLLADWRNANNFAYKEAVVATPESIKAWLENYYFNKPRMIFWVVYDGLKIGTIGLRDLGMEEWEIDSCIRGRSEGPGQMGIHLESIINLSLRFASYLTLRVIKNNQHAIDFYLKHNFKEFIAWDEDETYTHMYYNKEK